MFLYSLVTSITFVGDCAITGLVLLDFVSSKQCKLLTWYIHITCLYILYFKLQTNERK